LHISHKVIGKNIVGIPLNRFCSVTNADMLQVHQRTVHELSEGDVLSDKSASSSTGSVQMSANSTAASTDSITAPPETLSNATSGVVKIADIPLPNDRPHTISSAVYQPPVRPPIIPDTFEPPTSTVADIYSQPSLIGRSKDNRAPVAVTTPTVPVTAVPLPRDDCMSVTSEGAQPLLESSQHFCTEPSMSQKRKAVSTTHTHPFNGPLSGTTWVGRYQKGKNQSGFY